MYENIHVLKRTYKRDVLAPYLTAVLHVCHHLLTAILSILHMTNMSKETSIYEKTPTKENGLFCHMTHKSKKTRVYEKKTRVYEKKTYKRDVLTANHTAALRTSGTADSNRIHSTLDK